MNRAVSILVDDLNQSYALSRLGVARVIDYNALAKYLARSRIIQSSHAFTVSFPGQTVWADYLRSNCEGVKLKVHDKHPKLSRGNTVTKADWDIGIAVSAITIADSSLVDTIILVTGDGDFKPLVNYLRTQKRMRVEIASFGSTSWLLMEDKKFRNLSGKVDELTSLMIPGTNC